MKKATLAIVVLVLGTFLTVSVANAQSTDAKDSAQAVTNDSASSDSAESQAAPVKSEDAGNEESEETVAKAGTDEEAESKNLGIHETIKKNFVEGGVYFMGIVLICLILGLAIAIERIIALNLATTNSDKLLAEVRKGLETSPEAAQDLVSKTPGPIAAIFSQGLIRAKDGIVNVEKSIIAFGSVEMGKLERGLTWVSLFISLAPMFGFMGTVIGMIESFTDIQNSGDIKIDEVAGGIKTALLTTVGGLIVAVILQIFYNYLVSKIDAIVNQMEESSIAFVDLLVEKGVVKQQESN